MFCDHVYITSSDDLQNFNLHFSYREYFNHQNNQYNNILTKKPSKLSIGYTLRNKIIDKDYFDNLIVSRFNDVFIPLNFILPKINFLEKYELLNLDLNIEVIISNERYNTHENEHNNHNNTDNEAIMLIFPPKKYVNEYYGGKLIFKIENKEYEIDTTQFSHEFYTIIIYDKIDVTFEPITKGYRCIFKTVIRYSEFMIIEM